MTRIFGDIFGCISDLVRVGGGGKVKKTQQQKTAFVFIKSTEIDVKKFFLADKIHEFHE